ncbi:aminotransferase class IV, partial [Agrococcus sp. HG114]|uniref:aminotransferase class IV n=1 Tax=Agrococcus sp. HG114 TaxID=2969757 RepID=UPI00215A6937
MSAEQPVRAWTTGGFTPVDEPVGEPLAADSWLVVDGRVLAWQRHQLRFADAVADAGGDRLDALAAARAAIRLVPGEGRWSPRLDLTSDGIRLRVRPAPPASDAVEVVTASRDPRRHPHRKGPDLAALRELQDEESARAGRDVEPILLSAGCVAEGAWSAVLWWQGDVLHVPAPAAAHLPSVTAAVIAEVAALDGVEVQQRCARPADLDGAEVWLANALRGIRGGRG